MLPSPLCPKRCKILNQELCANRISKQLDVLTYLKKVMTLENMLKVGFSRSERYLLKNHRCFTVFPDDSDFEEASDDNISCLD